MTAKAGPCAFPRRQRVMVLTGDKTFRALFEGAFTADEVELTVLDHGRQAVQRLLADLPDLLVVDQDLPDIPGLQVVSLIKSENVYRQLPVVFVRRADDLEDEIDWCRAEIDELLLLPVTAAEIRVRVLLTLARASRSFDANPLTKLPGNTSIIQRIQELIDRQEDFALAYVDLDHFKSFNDRYGFSRGDEVLMMTARLIVNTIRGLRREKSFVGHVGGDDFVFLLPAEAVEAACQGIVASFDAIVPHFYDPEDRERGFIQSTDREGNMRTFPLMAVSIAVVFNRDGRLKHYGEASQIAMNLKKKAKENPRSCYVLDQRQS